MSAPAWVPAVATASVAGRSLPGGMLYVGKLSSGDASSRRNVEVIDPTLPIDWRRPDFAGQDMDYWPAYHSISPRSRAAYLLWLEGGRWAPDACIGYVFLYFYGLERRALVDAQQNPAARADLPRILGEVVRLLTVYGGNSSFRQYATAFQQVLRALITGGEGPPPDPAEHDHGLLHSPCASASDASPPRGVPYLWIGRGRGPCSTPRSTPEHPRRGAPTSSARCSPPATGPATPMASGSARLKAGWNSPITPPAAG